MVSTNYFRNFDYILLILTYVLVVFGVMMIQSATNGAVDATLVSRVPDQIRYAVIGTFLMIALSLVDYRLLGAMHTWLYILLLVMLLMVLFFGQEGDAGAKRWINVGILIQPSEIGKIIIIITLAHFLSMRYERMDRIETVIASGFHMVAPIILIFLQPNLSTTIAYAVIWGVLVWAAGLRIRHIVTFIAIVIVAFPIIWSLMQPYQRERITNFLGSPDSSEEATQGSFYNIRQAAISIGSGGFLGKGYMNGSQTQLRFLRVRHTDFIFSVIAEEFGLVGGVTVLGLISLVILRILRGARYASDALGSMICYGVAGIIFFQTFVSVGMNLGILPVTGLTLPFISSGGTSLLSIMMGLGLVQSVIVRRRRFT